MGDSEWDDRWLTRREWDSWRAEVYEYRAQEFERRLSSIMATIDHLDTVTGRLSDFVNRAQSVADSTEKLFSRWWIKMGVAVALIAPFGVVIVEHYWK